MANREDHPELWTAAEFLNSVEPQRMERASYAEDCADLVRRADVVAVMGGHGWSPDGEYPMAVWIETYQNF